jgi:hypothetical protein
MDELEWQIDQLRIDLDRCYGLKILVEERTKLRASVEVINDTALALKAFEEIRINGYEPKQYLLIYGMLQTFCTQQDALRCIGNVFELEIDVKDFIPAWELREARRFISHPVSTTNASEEAFCFIDRMTLNSESFQYFVYSSDKAHISSTFTHTIHYRRAIGFQIRFADESIRKIRKRIELVIGSLKDRKTIGSE